MVVNNDAIKLYMEKLGSLPLLTREEERELAARIAEGCEKSREKLITSNLRLVVKIAHDFTHLGLPLLDLIAEGNVGLMRAVSRFDPSKGAKFSSYAAWWIKQSIRRAVSNQARVIRIPVQAASKLSKIHYEQRRLRDELGREPTEAEIAEKLNFSERTVNLLQKTAVNSFSLQSFLKQGELNSYEDVVLQDHSHIPDLMVSESETCKRILSVLGQLDEREQLIIVRRFGLDGSQPWTLDQLSEVVGRTRERVRQIQFSALNKLKNLLDREVLE